MDTKISAKNLVLDIENLLIENEEIDVSYKKALKLLKRKLPINWANIISEQTGKKSITVYKVLDGTIRDTDNAILIKAIDLAKENAKSKVQTIKKIREI
jgi:hypothetical protein